MSYKAIDLPYAIIRVESWYRSPNEWRNLVNFLQQKYNLKPASNQYKEYFNIAITDYLKDFDGIYSRTDINLIEVKFMSREGYLHFKLLFNYPTKF